MVKNTEVFMSEAVEYILSLVALVIIQIRDTFAEGCVKILDKSDLKDNGDFSSRSLYLLIPTISAGARENFLGEEEQSLVFYFPTKVSITTNKTLDFTGVMVCFMGFGFTYRSQFSLL